MFFNLIEATKQYWRELDELEAADQQDKIPITQRGGVETLCF